MKKVVPRVRRSGADGIYEQVVSSASAQRRTLAAADMTITTIQPEGRRFQRLSRTIFGRTPQGHGRPVPTARSGIVSRRRQRLHQLLLRPGGHEPASTGTPSLRRKRSDGLMFSLAFDAPLERLDGDAATSR